MELVRIGKSRGLASGRAVPDASGGAVPDASGGAVVGPTTAETPTGRYKATGLEKLEEAACIAGGLEKL